MAAFQGREEESMTSMKRALATGGLAVAVGIVAACSSSNDMTQNGKGAVQFRMSASATSSAVTSSGGGSGSTSDTPQLQAANVTFSSILARNLDGQLIDVTIALPTTVDVLGLASGGMVTLPAGFLPAGTYDQLVIVMTKVALTLADGTIVSIEPPGGGWTAIVPVTQPFTVVDGQTTDVTINFHAGGAFHWLNGDWSFVPQFDCHGGDHGGHDSN
jgi:hypothetical protein